MDNAAIKSYIDQNKDRVLNELLDLLRIPSVSADSKYKQDVLKTAEAIKARLIEAGADKVEISPTKGFPVVYGEKIIDPKKPTVVVYGHYDVQPADPLELWHSPPFEPVIKKTELHPDGAIFARGSCDDKGQMYMHVKAFELMMKTNTLPCNVKFMIEGEEEVGSPSLGDWIIENKEKLKGDVILISDTSIIANDTPSIDSGLRGLAYMEVEVTGANRDLHSGVYGGGVANPINILCKIIASCHDENNHITIPDFYADVLELTKEQRDELNKAPFDINNFKKDLGIEDVWGEKGYNTTERTGVRPTLDVNGIWGGYTGEGAKTVLPSKAFAKISMRLVPNQSSDKISAVFQKYFESVAPKSVKIEVKPHHGGEPVVVSTESVGYKAASMAMEQTYGKKPIPTRGGGSIPIVALFKKELGLDSILLGFGLDTDALHSPNEHYGIFNYYKGIETIPLFYKYFTELQSK
ncbi:MAG: peptidase dimerization domain protein [Bacteroidetes bacterium]|nr:peptidase dimerization domain protein [Bacteroidota bacterium]